MDKKIIRQGGKIEFVEWDVKGKRTEVGSRNAECGSYTQSA